MGKYVYSNAWIKGLSLSAHTERTYATQVFNFHCWLGMDTSYLEPGAGQHEAVSKYVAFLLSEGKSPHTVNVAINAINKLYFYRGLPPVKIARQRLPKEAPKALGEGELRRVMWMVDQTASDRNKAILYTLIYSGLRISEVHQLNVGDIAINSRPAVIRVRHGKGMQYREVHICKALRPVLVSHLQTIDKSDSHRPLWINPKGDRLSYRAIDRIIRQFGKKTGLHLHCHLFRHTFLTNLLRRQVDIVTVAELGGHAKLETTRRYTLPTAEDKAKAVECLPVY